jgi:hypothetical protein
VPCAIDPKNLIIYPLNGRQGELNTWIPDYCPKEQNDAAWGNFISD